MRRLAALMLLREMAEQSPAVFNVHVKVCVWGGGGGGIGQTTLGKESGVCEGMPNP